MAKNFDDQEKQTPKQKYQIRKNMSKKKKNNYSLRKLRKTRRSI